MRLWHCELLKYLPDAQFRGQLREVVAVMHDWRDREGTNHLLINNVMDYPKEELAAYFFYYSKLYEKRYKKTLTRLETEFEAFAETLYYKPCRYKGWHNKKYLRICMANLAEKHFFGNGKSRISDSEWKRLCRGYKKITGDSYKV